MSFFSYPKPTSWYGDTVIRQPYLARMGYGTAPQTALCDTFSCLAAHLSPIAAAVATTSGKSLQNSCLFAKTVVTLHRRKETDDKINNKYKH